MVYQGAIALGAVTPRFACSMKATPASRSTSLYLSWGWGVQKFSISGTEVKKKKKIAALFKDFRIGKEAIHFERRSREMRGQKIGGTLWGY